MQQNGQRIEILIKMVQQWILSAKVRRNFGVILLCVYSIDTTVFLTVLEFKKQLKLSVGRREIHTELWL
jgi:hypothetical protein